MDAEPRYVVDANLIVKRFVDEPYSAQARRILRSSSQIVAPQFLMIEVGNAFLKKVRRGEITEEAALLALDAIPSFVQLLGMDSLHRAGWAIARQFNRSFYDALYVALALEENCPLITADQPLVNSTRFQLGEAVVWLGDMPA